MPAAKPAMIGGFVLGGLVLGVLAILLFGRTHWFSHQTRAVVYFQGSVAGLSVGAPVTFRGVRVGSVQTISLVLDPTDLRASIPVYVLLDPEQVSLARGGRSGRAISLPRLVDAGLRAQLGMQSIVTGQLLVDLDFRPGTRAARTGPDEGIPEIPAIASELQQLKNQLAALPLRDLVDNANRTLSAVQLLTSTLQSEVVPVVQDAHATLVTTRDTLQTASRAMVALQTDAAATLHDVDQLTRDGKRQLADKGARLDHVLVAADRATHDLDNAINTINGMTELRSPLRSNLEATMRDLSASASSLRGLAADLERNPSLILRGRGN